MMIYTETPLRAVNKAINYMLSPGKQKSFLRGDPLAFSLIPDRVTDSVFDLTPDLLTARGITLVLADLDNTLVSYENDLPTPALRHWKAELERAGITLFVVSNSRKSRRCPMFCESFGIPYVRHAGKPSAKGFRQALEQTGKQPSEALMVGDQIFTDICGANRAGVYSVLIKPVSWGKNPLRRIRYAIETPFRCLGQRRTEKELRYER